MSIEDYGEIDFGNYNVKELTETVDKQHTRYLAGNFNSCVENELLYQFEFPDVAGSLGHFLDTMKRVNSKQWNITLFHYRKTGYPSSSVLVGFQVKEKDHIFFKIFLNQLGYSYKQNSKL